MKLGIITDLHGNLPALEAMLPHLAGCDMVLCAGDFVDIGPWPEETVALARTIPNLISVRGNHENRILPDSPCHRKSPELQAHYAWTWGRLSEDSRAWLGALPEKRELTLEGREISLQHYGLREGCHYYRIHNDPGPETLRALFPQGKDIVVFGHDHAGTILRTAETLYLNCGALGCPGKDRDLARAAILDLGERIRVTPLRIRYDVQPVVREIQRLRMPDWENILASFYGLR